MGIIISILVSLVGVVEIFAFYLHLRRFCTTHNEELSDMAIIKKNYLDILGKRYTLNLQLHPGQGRNTSNYVLRTSPKAVLVGKTRFNNEEPVFNNKEPSSSKQTECRLNGACPMAIPVEESGRIMEETAQKVEGTSQGVKHKDTFYAKASTSKETYTIKESSKKKTLKHHKSEFFEKLEDPPVLESRTPSTSLEKIYLGEESSIDPIHGKRSSSPFPTYERMKPRGSICGELVENPKINVTEVDEVEDDDPQHTSMIYWSNSKIIRRGTSRSRSPSPKRKRAVDNDEVHRSSEDHKSSEFYGTKLTIRRKKHRSVSPQPRSEATQGYLNRRRRSKSFSNVSELKSSVQISDLAYQIVDKDYWSRSPSPFKELLEETEQNKFTLVFDEEFKNSLDGVKLKEGVKHKEDLKRNFRKKHAKKEDKVNKMLCYKEDEFLQPFKDVVTPSSSTEEFAGAILSNPNVVCGKSEGVNAQEAKPSTSKDVKKPEAFWVK